MTIAEAISSKAMELARGAGSDSEISERICRFVRDNILYSLQEWNVGCEETLRLREGMCAGKAWLAVNLHRAVGIRARFKVLSIIPEEGLFEFIARRMDENTASPSVQEEEKAIRSIRSLPPQRDHIIIQVCLSGQWEDVDVARDSELDLGMRFIGTWRERRIVSEEGPYEFIDNWIERRMNRISVTEDRQRFFHIVNEQIEQVRKIGRIVTKAGIQPWTDAEVRRAMRDWDIPDGCPISLESRGRYLDEIADCSRKVLTSLDEEARKANEDRLIDGLYVLVRHNIKRGRLWELPDVLSQRRADCLGYARILTLLATYFGIDAGVVEVVQDNRGKYVPHYVCLINPFDNERRLIDPWYGSSRIRHRLMTASVKEGESWVARQLSMEALLTEPQVSGLSPEQVSGISLYILGNSYLNQAMDDQALNCYNASLWLYPGNSRTLFNQAIVLERMGEAEQSQAGYRQALSTEPSLVRVLATAEDIEHLIDLDEKGVSEPEQRVYLMRKGFITGKEEGWKQIARTCEDSVSQVQAKYNSAVKALAL